MSYLGFSEMYIFIALSTLCSLSFIYLINYLFLLKQKKQIYNPDTLIVNIDNSEWDIYSGNCLPKYNAINFCAIVLLLISLKQEAYVLSIVLSVFVIWNIYSANVKRKYIYSKSGFSVYNPFKGLESMFIPQVLHWEDITHIYISENEELIFFEIINEYLGNKCYSHFLPSSEQYSLMDWLSKNDIAFESIKTRKELNLISNIIPI